MAARIRVLAFALLVMASGQLAHVRAQGWGSIDISIPMANTGYILSQQIVTAAYETPTKRSPTASPPSRPSQPKPATSTVIIRNAIGKSLVPEQLAANYPAGSRAQARQLFGELLGKYDPLMRQLGVPRDDYAGAAAAFVAGSYSAFNGVDFDDKAFAPLVRDIRTRLLASDQFAKASVGDKQSAFDQFAILGLMTATSQMALKQMPPGEQRDTVERNMREAGKRYLEQTFGVPADKIVIDADGLTF